MQLGFLAFARRHLFPISRRLGYRDHLFFDFDRFRFEFAVTVDVRLGHRSRLFFDRVRYLLARTVDLRFVDDLDRRHRLLHCGGLSGGLDGDWRRLVRRLRCGLPHGRCDGCRGATGGSGDVVFRNRADADPRAWLAPAARPVEGWREAVAAMATGHDFQRIALVEADTGLASSAESVGENTARVEIVSFHPEHVVLETESAAPGLLVLAEAWYPGWTATVDGEDGGPGA